ncbi:MAG TPA: YciI family protein [Opitutaceae bacterium]|nr:YciI family protein [Opitutaceae bacterium]
MHYLGLVYWNEKQWWDTPDGERLRILKECGAYGEELRRKGVLLDGSPLHPTSTATTLRKTDGRVLITDGPFAETKEVLGGYHLFACKDLDEAIAVSQKWPGLNYGMTLELRPLYDPA